MKKRFILAHDVARRGAMDAVATAKDGCVVEIREPGRSLDQNAMLWPILGKFSEQLEWPVNGRMQKLTAEDWKDLLTAAYRRE